MIYGSEDIYQVANCRMHHVTNSAMGKNIIEYWSILRLRGILKFIMNFHSQWEIMLSVFECMKMIIGTKLDRKAVLTARVIVAGEFWSFFDSRGSNVGVRMIMSVRRMEVLRSSASSITFTWICTKIGGS